MIQIKTNRGQWSIRINDIVHERRAISADTALRLARYFGASAEFWLQLQAGFDLETNQAGNGAKIVQDISPMTQAA